LGLGEVGHSEIEAFYHELDTDKTGVMDVNNAITAFERVKTAFIELKANETSNDNANQFKVGSFDD
jgi:acyl-CoA thioesterase FadM